MIHALATEVATIRPAPPSPKALVPRENGELWGALFGECNANLGGVCTGKAMAARRRPIYCLESETAKQSKQPQAAVKPQERRVWVGEGVKPYDKRPPIGTNVASVTVQPGGVASFGQQGGQTAGTIVNNPPVSPNAAATSYDFNGAKRISGNGGAFQSVSLGDEVPAFQEMLGMEKSTQWADLLSASEKWIKSTPEWLTPRIFAAEALLVTGDRDAACEHLRFVDEKTKGNPAYDVARNLLRRASCR